MAPALVNIPGDSRAIAVGATTDGFGVACGNFFCKKMNRKWGSVWV